jgi:hypothetical protein
MTKGQAAVLAKDKEMSLEEKHLIEHHLKVRIDKGRKHIEIACAMECDEKACPLPGECRVTFYFCPSRPCPPVMP